jgi:hypothetical protein
MLGIFLGTATRKTVPAMALTLIIFVIVRVLIVNFLRPYYLPPITRTFPINAAIQAPEGSWIISNEMVDRSGQSLSFDALQVCQALLSQNPTDQTPYNQCISEHGFENRIVYQPADRYWLLQGIESGLYLLLTTLLFALTFWWIKYRITGSTKERSKYTHQKKQIPLLAEDASIQARAESNR